MNNNITGESVNEWYKELTLNIIGITNFINTRDLNDLSFIGGERLRNNQEEFICRHNDVISFMNNKVNAEKE